MSKQEIIGLTGGMCSGKDSWGDFLAEHFSYVHSSTSNIAREYIRDHNLGEPTRDLTRETATYLREVNGPDYLLRRALEKVEDHGRIVVTGLYVVPEVVHLKRIGGSLINVVADDTLRYSRMSHRGRSGELSEYEEYKRLMNNDLSSTETDQRLAEVIRMADYEIDGKVPIRDTDTCKAIARRVLQEIALGGRC